VTGTWVTEQGGMTSATKILAAGDMIGYIQDNAGGVPVTGLPAMKPLMP
jgi:hypothetical protein